MSILSRFVSVFSARGISSSTRAGSHRVNSNLRGRPQGGTSFVRQYLRRNRK